MRVLKPKKSSQRSSADNNANDHKSFRESDLTEGDGSVDHLVDILHLGDDQNNTDPEESDRGSQSNTYVDKVDDSASSNESSGKRSRGQSQGVDENKRKIRKDEAGDASEVYQRGVALLAIREHSTLELRNKLKVKFPNSISVDDVIDRLLQDKYLSDERFTEAYVRVRKSKGFGPSRIRSELMTRGVSDDLIHDHLHLNSASWLDAAKRQYLKKFHDTPITDYREWTKRARFLQGKGFNREHIDDVLPSITEQSHD